MKSQRLDSALARWMKRTHKDFTRGRTGGRETPDKAKELFRRQPYAKGDNNGNHDKLSGGDDNRGNAPDCLGGVGQ